jgi:diguanylate cyclase (GGDEF)-like protein/PAS domain S-box-containing protein
MSARDPLLSLQEPSDAAERLSAAQLRAVFDTTACGLVVQDAVGHIVDCNDAAERLLGLSRAQMTGLTSIDPRWRAVDAQGNDLPGDQHPSMQTLRTGQSLHDVVMGVCRPCGTRTWLKVSTRLLPADGAPWVVASFTDHTTRHQMQLALADQSQRLQATLEGTRAATWEWNVQTGETRFNERWAQIVGWTLAELAEEAPVNVDTWMRLVHPDDLKASSEQLQRHFAGELPYYDLECRMRHRDGSWRWVHDRGRVSSTTADGQPLWMFGTQEDITARKSAERAKDEAQQRLRALFELMPVGIVLFNERTQRPEQTNPAMSAMLGWTAQELTDPEREHHVTPLHLGKRRDWNQALERTGRFGPDQTELLHRDGHVVKVLNTGVRYIAADGTPYLWAVTQDIGPLLAAEHDSRHTQALLQTLFERAPLGIKLFDAATQKNLKVNDALSHITGYSPQELLSGDLHSRIAPEFESAPEQWQRDLDRHGHFGPCEAEYIHRQGHRVRLAISGVRAADTDGRPLMWSLVQDVTERHALLHRLEYAATRDRLTGLPNRSALTQALGAASARAREEPGYAFALLFLDFDRFKLVNDTLGHAAGDDLLQAVAQRLQSASLQAMEPEGCIARFGGDEFVLLAPGLQTEAEVRSLGQRLLAALEQPYAVQGKSVRSSASIGVALSQGAQTEASDLLRDADIAMYEAKRNGRGQLVMFNDRMRHQLSRAVRVETALHQALALNQMHVVYQPIVDLDSGHMTSVEALLRWTHPELGAVSPAEFIPIAEESGHVMALGEWVLRQSCLQWKRWQQEDAALAPATVSVNLSRVQLSLGERLLTLVRSALAEADMPAAALQLEITEREVSHQASGTRELMQALRSLGVKLAMDDFGTGASSLGCLREFPFDTIKIDKSFVTDLCNDPHVLAVAHATVNVIENLGMVSVAEGVEEPGELATLQSLGCRYGQGWLFGRPMAPELLLPSRRAG